MQLSFTEKKNIRKNFGKLKESLSIPNLIEVQKNSYKQLTEYSSNLNSNLVKGFNRVFNSIFPIEDINEKRGAAGALSNRLDLIMSNLDNSKVNLIKSRSTIEDADFAAESMKLAKAKILEQVAIAMIAQANARTQWILKLLEN